MGRGEEKSIRLPPTTADTNITRRSSTINRQTLPPEIDPVTRARLRARLRGLLRARSSGPKLPKMKPWDERPPRAQVKLTSSLNSFQSWRRENGEMLPADSWTAQAPTLEKLADYLQILRGTSSSWRTYSVQALRMYLVHVGRPELAAFVVLPRRKAASAGVDPLSPE